jgi:hypothetical protein
MASMTLALIGFLVGAFIVITKESRRSETTVW